MAAATRNLASVDPLFSFVVLCPPPLLLSILSRSYKINSTVSNRVGRLNPSWLEEDGADMDVRLVLSSPTVCAPATGCRSSPLVFFALFAFFPTVDAL